MTFTPHRWRCLIVVLMLGLAGWLGFHGYLTALRAAHGRCCFVEPAIDAQLARFRDAGAIDLDRAAPLLGLPAWGEAAAVGSDKRLTQSRESYDAAVYEKLLRDLADSAVKCWEDDAVSAATKLLLGGLFAGGLAVSCGVVAWLARPPGENSFP